MRARIQFLLLNIAHFLDHLFMLVFATLAALTLATEWQLAYSQLILYATPGFVAFGAFALPAGWLADRWSRHGMMVVFFIGIGVASILCALAGTPLQMSFGLFSIGLFAAIYHPVGIALVLGSGQSNGLRVAVNGVWGNMGVACAALLTAFFIVNGGWRAAFVVPGVFSIILGVIYFFVTREKHLQAETPPKAAVKSGTDTSDVFGNRLLIRVLTVVFLTTALGGLVFQSTTFALPRVLAERVTSLSENALLAANAVPADSAALVGQLAFVAFFAGSMGQLVVGFLLDRISVRKIFLGVSALQALFFAIAISATNQLAIIAAVGYMLAAFGQIPINDVLVGRVSQPGYRSRILGIRYTITILVMAMSIPLIASVHHDYGFGALFKILVVAATLIFIAAFTLPAHRLLNQQQAV